MENNSTDKTWKIGCLGPRGTFTEQAVLKYLEDSVNKNCFIQYYNTIDDAIFAAENGEVDESIIPFENSIEGTVNLTLDSLIFDANLFIKAQIILPISQNMFVNKNFNGTIDTVLSHPQGLAQSRKFLREHYKNTTEMSVSSTSEAGRLVGDGMRNAAAIGTILLEELYDLKLIHFDIQENKQNKTTFVVVTKNDTSVPKKNHKTSLAFSTRNEPGELYKLLDIFALWDLNMTKIQSRPMKGKQFEYVFLIDIEGYEKVEDVNDALKMVSRKTSFYKNLGSYEILE